MRTRDRRLIAVAVAGLLVAAGFIATAVAGQRDAVRREALTRARVWCEALVARDALRYQEAFRRNYFRGDFDRFTNTYKEAKEPAILAQMPKATSCRAGGVEPGPRGDVYVPVDWRGPSGEHHVRLRMRREGGFLLVTIIES